MTLAKPGPLDHRSSGSLGALFWASRVGVKNGISASYQGRLSEKRGEPISWSSSKLRVKNSRLGFRVAGDRERCEKSIRDNARLVRIPEKGDPKWQLDPLPQPGPEGEGLTNRSSCSEPWQG